MKMNLLAIIAYFAIFSCDKEDNSVQLNKNDLLWVWVNLSNTIDTVKIDDSTIERIDTVWKQYSHFYSYNVDKSSIIIKYIGLGESFVELCKIMISFNESKSEITCEGLSKYHPKYPGETFEKIK